MQILVSLWYHEDELLTSRVFGPNQDVISGWMHGQAFNFLYFVNNLESSLDCRFGVLEKFHCVIFAPWDEHGRRRVELYGRHFLRWGNNMKWMAEYKFMVDGREKNKEIPP